MNLTRHLKYRREMISIEKVTKIVEFTGVGMDRPEIARTLELSRNTVYNKQKELRLI